MTFIVTYSAQNGVDALEVSVVNAFSTEPITPSRVLSISSDRQDALVVGLSDGSIAQIHRGDADETGTLDLTDPISILELLFEGTAAPRCREASDANNDGVIDISDAVWLLSFLFSGGPPPPAPGPPGFPCGDEPDPQDALLGLGCRAYSGCQ
jgi:hypothetical protein